MRRPDSSLSADEFSDPGSVVSSQSLIMQDRPDGLPAKTSAEAERHR